MKLLVLSDIPAPYRVAVFKGLSQVYDIDVFFNSASNDQRNERWYIRTDGNLNFVVLGSSEADSRYAEVLSKLDQYDLVLCYDPWNKRSRALARACMRKRIPYILNADGALRINMKLPQRIVKSFYVKRARCCFAGCERAAEYFRAYGAKEAQIVKHPFTSLYAQQILPQIPTTEQKADLRKELGMAEGCVFITAGQFIPRKGYDLLLNAWSKTKQTGSLYIIGGGPLKEEYKQIINENELKNIHVKEFMPPQELFRWLEASDVFVMPTREDIWGLVVNEAMANGLPVISSDRCTAGNELIENGKNGFVYPCEDVECLAGHIETLAGSVKLCGEMGGNALEAIREHTLENIIQRHVETIKTLL